MSVISLSKWTRIYCLMARSFIVALNTAEDEGSNAGLCTSMGEHNSLTTVAAASITTRNNAVFLLLCQRGLVDFANLVRERILHHSPKCIRAMLVLASREQCGAEGLAESPQGLALVLGVGHCDYGV